MTNKIKRIIVPGACIEFKGNVVGRIVKMEEKATTGGMECIIDLEEL